MNQQTSSFYVLDAGNTRVKIAEFQRDELVGVRVFDYINEGELFAYLASIKNSCSLLSGVVEEDSLTRIADVWLPTVRLNATTPLPISLEKYKTSSTLGVDRIANAVAGHHFSGGKNALVIDIGTCLKFDFVDEKGNYHGGSIAPGVALRFKSMNDYTANLPLIEEYEQSALVGDSTKNSLMSGVINGMTAEIDGFIERYTQQFPQLTIFLTGGDAILFDNALKSSIFVDQNFTLKGLFLILKHNV
jgi:type III pantothenate kinase